MRSQPEEQVEIITKAVSSRMDRALFISDPFGYAKERGVSLDGELVKNIVSELKDVERASAMLGMRNDYLDEYKVDIPGMSKIDISKSPIELAAWPLVAYYVVTTAAAVVSAVSTTYNATNWLTSRVR